MIHCRHIRKAFGEFQALDDISLELNGGICALLGPNGAGKSTLLKILGGLLQPDRGEVRVAGFDVSREPLPLKRAIGVLPEDLGLFDALTIEEHLDLCGPIYGLSAAETEDRAGGLLRVLGLQNERYTYLDQCSHGMRKKTALAMALLHSPRVLLLDEPFEGIDPVSAKTIRDLLVTITGREITVFLTSHVLSMVERLPASVLLIRGGRIVWDSASQPREQSLEELYFDLVDAPADEDLAWLRWSRF